MHFIRYLIDPFIGKKPESRNCGNTNTFSAICPILAVLHMRQTERVLSSISYGLKLCANQLT